MSELYDQRARVRAVARQQGGWQQGEAGAAQGASGAPEQQRLMIDWNST